MSDGKRKLGLWTWVLIGGEVALILLVLNWFLTRDRGGDEPAPGPPASEQTEQAADVPPAVTPRDEAQAEPDVPSAPGGGGTAEAPVETAAVDARTEEPGEEVSEPPVGSDDPGGARDDPAPPDFDLVRVDPSGNALIAGQAAAGSAVVLMVEGRAAARAVAGPDGAFTLFADLPPDTDPRRLSLRMDLADGRKIASAATVILAPTPVAEPAPADDVGAGDKADALAAAEPDRESPIEARKEERNETASADSGAADAVSQDSGPGAVAEMAVVTGAPAEETAPVLPAPRTPAVLLSDAGGVQVLQAPAGDLPPGTAGVLIEAISYDAGGAVVLAGRGEPGGALRLYLDNAAIAEARIDEAGRWRRRIDEVAAGVYNLRADLLNPDGTVGARFETPFQREPTETLLAAAPGAVPAGTEIRAITVQPGFTLWGIADRTYGSGFQYIKIFRANRDQIQDPDLIYPGQVFDLPAGD
ncbi:MAG: LysM peptidoglycan-binding domain-containing protein [Rhodovulum sp.]